MTDTKTLHRDTSTDPPAERKKLFDMSATQLAGGALAAMTSAVIGARLGVAGTVIGAAIGSLVAGIAGSLYTASLRHTREKLSAAIVGKVGDTKVELTTVSDDTFVSDGSRTGQQAPIPEQLRGYGQPAEQSWHWDTTEPAAAVAPVSGDPVAADVVVDEQGRTVRQWPWKTILVSTAAVFLLAIAGITGFELISGQSVSGGQGTTIGQVSDGRSGGSATTPSEKPSSTPSSEASSTPSSEPSTSTEPSSEPSSSGSSEPMSEPSSSSEPSASSEPSTSQASSSVTPSTAAGDADQPADSGDAGEGGARAGG